MIKLRAYGDVGTNFTASSWMDLITASTFNEMVESSRCGTLTLMSPIIGGRELPENILQKPTESSV